MGRLAQIGNRIDDDFFEQKRGWKFQALVGVHLGDGNCTFGFACSRYVIVSQHLGRKKSVLGLNDFEYNVTMCRGARET